MFSKNYMVDYFSTCFVRQGHWVFAMLATSERRDEEYRKRMLDDYIAIVKSLCD